MNSRHGTGCIRWPERNQMLTTTGENGMWVYAFFTEEQIPAQLDMVFDHLNGTDTAERRDPFIRCHGPTATLSLPAPGVVATPLADVIYPAADIPPIDGLYDAGVPILAGVCLGSTDKVYVDKTCGEYWYASTADLTRRGWRLIQALSMLYGSRPWKLLTYVDT